MKASMPVFIFPVDQKTGKVVTMLPGKKRITLHMRDVDVENAEKLRRMKGITVLSSPKDVQSIILSFLENEKRT